MRWLYQCMLTFFFKNCSHNISPRCSIFDIDMQFFCLLNSFSFDKKPRSWDELPEKWTDEEKRDFLAKQPERRKKARSLMYILLPMILTIGINYIELTFLK